MIGKLNSAPITNLKLSIRPTRSRYRFKQKDIHFRDLSPRTGKNRFVFKKVSRTRSPKNQNMKVVLSFWKRVGVGRIYFSFQAASSVFLLMSWSSALKWCIRYGEAFEMSQAAELQSHLEGSSLNSKTLSGNTILHFAALHTSTTLLEYVASCLKYVNTKNEKGETPLHWACSNGNLAAVEVLIKYGANTRLRDAGKLIRSSTKQKLILLQNETQLFNLQQNEVIYL